LEVRSEPASIEYLIRITIERYLSMPRQQNKDDNNIWLIGAGILATVIGAAGTFMLSSNNSGSKKGNTISLPKKAGCGCGAKH